MPRYELVEGTSSKFWEITLDGSSFTTTYGRIGTSGQSTLKEFASPEVAKTEHDKLVAEKVKKGYSLVGAGGGAAAEPASAKKPVFDDEGDDEGDEAPAPKAKPAPKPAAASGSSKSGTSGARYFELVEGTSSKFWEIKLEGTSYTTRYGRIGTPGQETLKEYGTADKARAEYEKIVAEKTKKGYREK
jgi:predicted DNA-binding WGR domain protein